MKRIIVGAMLLAFATAPFCQQPVQKQTPVQIDYLKKSKSQKKAGRILLATGTGFLATSFIIPRGELIHDGICIGVYCDTKYKNDEIKAAFFIAGGLSALGSIPFFIASSKSKKRAAKTLVSLKMETRPFVRQASLVKIRYPVIAMKFNL